MKKKIKVLVVLLFVGFAMNGQDLGIGAAAENFWDELRSAAKYIIAGIFLISVLFNIGKVIGNDRDYKGFLSGVAIFFFSLLLIGSVIAYILSLDF